ncbi:MAG TPA: hypothetical protein VF832_01265 [Longimicrobiales bacterium]
MTRPATMAGDRAVALAALCGGVLIALGAYLPWLSFFAGLYPVRGILGLWGRLLAAGGVACMLAGAGSLARPHARLQPLIALLGCALALFAVWVAFRLLSGVRQLQATDVMIVPRLGPGLFIALTGTLLTSIPAVLSLRRGQFPEVGRPPVVREG